MTAEEEIKTMQLYSHMDRVKNEVKAVEAALGISTEQPLSYKAVQGFTCLNYTGVSGVDASAKAMGLKSGSEGEGKTLLDIGCGLCGPARHLPANYNCTVVGVELQTELAEASAWLSKRCGIDADRIKVVNANAATDETLKTLQAASSSQYDAAYSLLSVLHFSREDRLKLWSNLSTLMKKVMHCNMHLFSLLL